MTRYKYLLKGFLEKYFPMIGKEANLTQYEKENQFNLDVIQTRMSTLTPAGYTEKEAWQRAWQSQRQNKQKHKKLRKI